MKRQTNPIKKYVLIAFVFILASSCKEASQSTECPELEDCKKKIEAYEKEISALKAQLEDVVDGKQRRPENIIQSDFAKEIYHLYDKREELINEVTGQDGDGEPFKATRSLFYDINDLQKYIRYVKEKSRKANVRPSGFRFYFALYPDNYVRDRENKKYAKRQTFFIAPTVRKTVNGEVMDLGYTLDNEFNVELLTEKIGLDSRTGKDGKVYQKAGFFNLNLNSFEEENSLIANELAGSPPMGKDE
ncbi:hypothetical protein [Aquimarina sp. SS2-1]|uniref:hypothetical protein n=1 Tax=Aquimarina besae TaxID=3342247 RepID=UPI00366E1C51